MPTGQDLGRAGGWQVLDAAAGRVLRTRGGWRQPARSGISPAHEGAGHLEDFGAEIRGHYLDTATYGIPPRGVLRDVAIAMQRWREGAADWREDWEPAAEDARGLFAQLVHVAASSVALMPAVSVATSIVATAVPVGGEVLVAEEDFASLLYPFLEAERRGRLHVRAVPLERLTDEIGSATSMVAVSHVQSADGTVLDVVAVRHAADQVGAALYLDATHSVGVLPAAGPAWNADYLACAAYKWLCCPRGVGFLYLEPSCWDRPISAAASWHGEARHDAPHYGSSLDLAADARRFDVSIGWHAWVGARRSLLELVRVGDARSERTRMLTGALAEALELPEPRAGIVHVPVRDAAEADAALQRRGVRATVRDDAVRLSPYFYNTEGDVEAAVAALAGCRS
jgi:selenocysteine lyase/cysteine desulfurase